METRSCAGLYPRAHEVLCLFSQKVDRWGFSKASTLDVAQRLCCREQEVRDAIADLEDFLTRGKVKDHWRVLDRCLHPCADIIPSTRLSNQKQMTPNLIATQNGSEDHSASLRNLAHARVRVSRVRTRDKDITSWKSWDLVGYFYEVAPPEVRVELNKRALAGNFARWMREGRTAPQIKKMIDLFLQDPGKNPSKLAWLRFLQRSRALYTRATEYRQTMEEHRYDAAYWGPVNV